MSGEWEFKVGDRVGIINGFHKGEIVTILQQYQAHGGSIGNEYIVLGDFDNRWYFLGHDLVLTKPLRDWGGKSPIEIKIIEMRERRLAMGYKF